MLYHEDIRYTYVCIKIFSNVSLTKRHAVQKEQKLILYRGRYLSSGICNEIWTTFNYGRRRRIQRRREEYRTLLNRAAKSSAARTSARAHRGIPSLYSVHERIDKATPIRISIRWQRRSSLAGTTGYAESGAGFTEKSESSPGTIVRETLRDYSRTTPSDCLMFIAHRKLLRNFSETISRTINRFNFKNKQ